MTTNLETAQEAACRLAGELGRAEAKLRLKTINEQTLLNHFKLIDGHADGSWSQGYLAAIKFAIKCLEIKPR